MLRKDAVTRPALQGEWVPGAVCPDPLTFDLHNGERKEKRRKDIKIFTFLLERDDWPLRRAPHAATSLRRRAESLGASMYEVITLFWKRSNSADSCLCSYTMQQNILFLRTGLI